MSISCSPPASYQQWLDCFQHLQQRPHDRQMLDTLALGTYIGQPAETFLARLSDCVSLVLTAHCRRFLRQLDDALAEGEPDMAMLLAARFRKSLQACFFYRSLSFLRSDYVRTLDEGFGAQLDSFWQNFLEQLQKSVKDSMDPRMEDIMYEMKRLKLTQRACTDE